MLKYRLLMTGPFWIRIVILSTMVISAAESIAMMLSMLLLDARTSKDLQIKGGQQESDRILRECFLRGHLYVYSVFAILVFIAVLVYRTQKRRQWIT